MSKKKKVIWCSRCGDVGEKTERRSGELGGGKKIINKECQILIRFFLPIHFSTSLSDTGMICE